MSCGCPQADDGAWQAGATLTPEQLLRLSKWESIWFYSFNVHGERHLLRDVLNCMHSPGYEDVSDYMHHFVCEENNHSWFFSNFCTVTAARSMSTSARNSRRSH